MGPVLRTEYSNISYEQARLVHRLTLEWKINRGTI